MTNYIEKKFRHMRTANEYLKKLVVKYGNDPRLYTVISKNGTKKYMILNPTR